MPSSVAMWLICSHLQSLEQPCEVEMIPTAQEESEAWTVTWSLKLGGGQGPKPGSGGLFPHLGGQNRMCFSSLSPFDVQHEDFCIEIYSNIYWIVNRIFISIGALLWKIEQKSNRAFACGKVTIKGKRHWYEALPQAVFVALSDDTAWIIRTSGDLYLQTGNRGLRSGACQLCHHCLCCTLLC